MGIRAEHKTKIKQFLESIEFENTNLTVVTNYQNFGRTDPYLFITSAGFESEVTGDVQIDNISYYTAYRYRITCVFLANENADGVQEDRIDDIEELVVDKLRSRLMRDNEGWDDFILKQVSEPYSLSGPDIIDNKTYLDFEVEVRIITNF